nr:hypothetical protein Iba_chr04bCG18620 [Ipomoea batatas]
MHLAAEKNLAPSRQLDSEAGYGGGATAPTSPNRASRELLLQRLGLGSGGGSLVSRLSSPRPAKQNCATAVAAKQNSGLFSAWRGSSSLPVATPTTERYGGLRVASSRDGGGEARLPVARSLEL